MVLWLGDLWHRLIGWVRDEGGPVELPNVPPPGREGWLVPRTDYERHFPATKEQVVDRELVEMGGRVPYLQRTPWGSQ